jgi:PKD repeat protein
VTDRRSRKSLRTHHRSLAALLALLGAAALALSANAVPAGAIVVKLRGRAVGVTPINNARGEAFSRAHARVRRLDELPKGGIALTYHGGPVMHSSTTHVIYWDPSKEFSETTKGIVGKYFTDTAHDSGLGTNVFGVDGQFTDGSGFAAYESTSTTALADSDAYPGSGCAIPEFEADPGPYSGPCLTDEQLQTELKTFIAAKSLPTGPTQFYALLLPHQVVTCFEEEGEICSNDVFCAYHSAIKPGTAGEILYANIPFSLLDTTETFGFPDAKGCQDDGHDANIQQPNPDNAGGNSATRFADVALKYISHEFNETITDPVPPSGWIDANEQEDGDKCNGVSADPSEDGIGYDKNAFLPVLGGEFGTNNLFDQTVNGDHFYVQSEWDNVAKACRMTPLPITEAAFTSSASPVEGSPVEFKGKATDPYGHEEFLWTFGDGTEGTGASPSHTYAFAGSYEPTMTARDARTRATSAVVKHKINVDELPLPGFIEYEPERPRVGETVKFTDVEAEDEDGTIVKYTWDFGDESATKEGEKVEHKYTEPGEYAVSVTVEDSSKLTAEESELVEVIDRPTVVTEPASAISQVGATLNASVNPNGDKASCTFEYGKTLAYGKTAPCSAPPGSGFSSVAVSAAIGELEPGTEYHFRIAASNSVGEREGADKTFTTLAKLPPTAAAEAATSVTQTAATLNATVNPNGAEVTECKFEYGTSASFYEASAPCATLPGGGTGAVAVSAAIGGLSPGTTYHFRLVAKSAGGPGAGPDATFATVALPAPPPKEEVKTPPPPDSTFTASAAFSRSNGAITLSATVKDPGTFKLLATFANGKFGVFSAAAKCKKGQLRLAGKCRPAKITFAKGTATVPAAGTVRFTLKPSASARKALKSALKHKKGLPVTITLTFQSARGGTPTSHTLSIVVKLKKK